MTKKYFEVLKEKMHILPLLLVAILSVGLVSCDGGDDDDDVTEFGDYHFVFTLVDRGTFSSADANAFIGSMNADIGYLQAVSKDQAIYVFDKEIESLRTGFAGENGFEISFKVALVDTNNKTIRSKTVSIKQTGCDIR